MSFFRTFFFLLLGVSLTILRSQVMHTKTKIPMIHLRTEPSVKQIKHQELNVLKIELCTE